MFFLDLFKETIRGRNETRPRVHGKSCIFYYPIVFHPTLNVVESVSVILFFFFFFFVFGFWLLFSFCCCCCCCFFFCLFFFPCNYMIFYLTDCHWHANIISGHPVALNSILCCFTPSTRLQFSHHSNNTKMQSSDQLARTDLWYLPISLSCLSVQYWASLHPWQPFSSVIRSDNCPETIKGELGRIRRIQYTLQEDCCLIVVSRAARKDFTTTNLVDTVFRLKLQIYTNIVNLFKFIWKWKECLAESVIFPTSSYYLFYLFLFYFYLFI